MPDHRVPASRFSPGWPAPGPLGTGESTAGSPTRRPARSRALLAVDRALLEVSWPLPKTRDLALDAVRKLERLLATLAEQRPAITEPDVRNGIDVLLRRGDFMLPHWAGRLATFAADDWSAADADALTQDLAEIARTGAQICNLIADPPAAPRPSAALGADPIPTAGHRRTHSAAPARQPAPDTLGATEYVIGAFTQLPLVSRRLLLQAFAIIPAGLAVAAVCYFAWDRHHPATPPAKSHPTRSTSGAAMPASSASSARPAPPESPTSAAQAPASAPPVTSLQIQLLGASSTQPSVEAVVYLDTASPVPVEVQITYHGTVDPADPRPVTDYERLAGRTTYQFALSIDAVPYCGGGVVVSALAGGFPASQTTSAGPCPTTSSSSTTE